MGHTAKMRAAFVAATRVAQRQCIQRVSTTQTPMLRSLKSVQNFAPTMKVRFMSTAKAGEEAKEETATADNSEPAKEDAEEPAAEAEAEPELTPEQVLEAKVAELEETAAEMENRWKRALADSENTRGMAQREIANAKKFAVQGFAKSMLDVCDNLALALAHTPEDQLSGDVNPQLKVLFEGVQMTEKILMSSLEKHGVTR